MTASGRSIGGQDAKRLAKQAISLAYFVVRGFSRVLLQAMGRSPDPRLVVLYYHGIPTADRANFARQLQALEQGARVWPAFHRGSLPPGNRNVAITFDDAYVSVAENALPELAARGFHSTIFVPMGSLGRAPTWPMEEGSLDASETVMPAEQIARLPSSLVTLGSHTTTHPRLSRIDASEAREEIEGSRVKLQTLTTQDVRLFAFPYGDHDSSVVELCKGAGYDYVFTTMPQPVDTMSSDFVRGRVRVDPFDGPLEFFLKYRGAYAWMPHVSSFKQKLTSYRKPRETRQPSYSQSILGK